MWWLQEESVAVVEQGEEGEGGAVGESVWGGVCGF